MNGAAFIRDFTGRNGQNGRFARPGARKPLTDLLPLLAGSKGNTRHFAVSIVKVEPSIRNRTIGIRHVPEASATRLNGDLGRNLDLTLETG